MRMKSLLFIGILFALPFCASAQESTAIDSSYLNGHYAQRLDFFRKMPNKKREIIFLGNSITEGGKWQELIRLKHVINRGISGDVTFGVLARLDEVLEARPAKLFLLIGINDMKRGIPHELILRNYKKIIKRVKDESPGTKVYIQSILPINKWMLSLSYSKLSNDAISAFNRQLQDLCVSERLCYVNLHEVFAGADGSMRKELSIDGLHLRSAAYIEWANYLKKINAL